MNREILIRADEDQKCLAKICQAVKPGTLVWRLACGLKHKSIDTSEPLSAYAWVNIVELLIFQRRIAKKCDSQLVRCAIARLRDARAYQVVAA